MSWVLRCLEGSCGWGMTLAEHDQAVEVAKEHVHGPHIVVMRGTQFGWLSVIENDGELHELKYDEG